MTDEQQSLSHRITQSIKAHIRVAMIAVVFGMTAYGLIHVFVRLVHYVETL